MNNGNNRNRDWSDRMGLEWNKNYSISWIQVPHGAWKFPRHASHGQFRCLPRWVDPFLMAFLTVRASRNQTWLAGKSYVLYIWKFLAGKIIELNEGFVQLPCSVTGWWCQKTKLLGRLSILRITLGHSFQVLRRSRMEPVNRHGLSI
jgi:hypothetical protein